MIGNNTITKYIDTIVLEKICIDNNIDLNSEIVNDSLNIFFSKKEKCKLK